MRVRRRSSPGCPNWPHEVAQHRRGSPPLPRSQRPSSAFAPAKKPSHWPSGEKKGLTAPSVPGMGLGLQAVHRPQIKLLGAALDGNIREMSAVG